MCRQKAAEAKQSAAKAKNPLIKRAFEEVAAGWRVLAEQMEWTDRQKSPYIVRVTLEGTGWISHIPLNEVVRVERRVFDSRLGMTVRTK
jgi:hypothetical protein